MNNKKMTKVTFIKSCKCSAIYSASPDNEGIVLEEYVHKCDTHKDLSDVEAFWAAAELERLANLGEEDSGERI